MTGESSSDTGKAAPWGSGKIRREVFQPTAGSTLDVARQAGADAFLGRLDHLTMLPNRSEFLADFADWIGGKADRPEEFMLGLVTLADAGHFNGILRALGHGCSETFIRTGADRVLAELPAGTKVYHVSVLSFAFFLEPPRDATVPAPLDRLVGAFASPLVCDGIPIDSRVGIGLTRQPIAGADPSEILRAALVAAQDSRGRDRGWAWYDRRSDEAQVRAFNILAGLRPAIESADQFSFHYQPRVSLKNHRCLSAEALIRWSHPVLGPVSPDEFIPIVEATALIKPFTRSVVEQAVTRLAAWKAAGIELQLSVNVSPKNLIEPDFVEFLLDRCRSQGVAPAKIELEFTEGSLATDTGTIVRTLEALRAEGMQIAIDDFGSGYSNLNYLASLPAQRLKIDKAFVMPMSRDLGKPVLVHSIIRLAHTLGYEVVAEGIEDPESYRMLADWNCDEGQGYLIGRPMPDSDLRDWLARHRRRPAGEPVWGEPAAGGVAPSPVS